MAHVIPLHLGALHPYETALTLLLAFGPFVALAVVVVVRRRQDAAEAESDSISDADGRTRPSPTRSHHPS